MSFPIPKALPSLSPPTSKTPSLPITCKLKQSHSVSLQKSSASKCPIDKFQLTKSSLAIKVGAFLATAAQPALAVTGENNPEDFSSLLTQWAIVAFLYLILFPPIIMNWLRIRWYRRNAVEMFFQFMFVFIFFPSLLLWAPFLNFRKFPRDPTMKYPWSIPQNPSQIKNGFQKYPNATPEDYE